MKTLRIDLTRETISEEQIDEKITTRYVGGRGLGAAILTQEVPPQTEPFSQDNKLVFTPGTIFDSGVPFSGRHNVTGISPLTNTIFSSNAGGSFGYELGSTDCSALVIEGIAPELRYLYIYSTPEGAVAELRDAGSLRYKNVFETVDFLKDAHNVRDRNIASIGEPGERLVKFAGIMVQKHRTFGRGGLGAVMGSKNLKAIVVRGKNRRDDRFREIRPELNEKVRLTPSGLKTNGTASILAVANKDGALPAKYYSKTTFKYADQIDAGALNNFTVGKSSCLSCPIGCKRVTESKKYSIKTEGPEYETLMALGSNICVSDLDGIIKSNHLCNMHGLDTISCGAAIGALMHASEMGKIDYPIRWGDVEKVHEVIDLVARREGVGDDLACGVSDFAKKYKIISYTVKGLELPGHDARGLHGQGLGFMTSNRGADHLYSAFYMNEYRTPGRQDVKGKSKDLIHSENVCAVLDSLGICKFSLRFFDNNDYLRLLSLSTGKEFNDEDMQEMGADIIDLERRFNCKRGFSRKDDVLPPGMEMEGADEELSHYYRLRKWDDNGCI